jgi:predicted TPR repeat methyltransferase
MAEQTTRPTGAAVTMPIPLTAGEALDVGVNRLRAGQADEAEQVFSAVLAIEPENATALHFTGIIRHKQGKTTEAVALIRRALDQAPRYLDAYVNLGNIHNETGELLLARDMYVKALELEPNHVGAYNNLGVTMQNLNSLDLAKQCFEKALAIDPNNGDVYQNLGNVYRLEWNFVEACANFRKAIALRPYNAEAYRYLAFTLYMMNERDEAVKLIRQWMEFDPDNPASHHLLAAFSGENVPDRAADTYVRQIFDAFAPGFDSTLKNLQYRAPDLVAQEVSRIWPEAKADLDVLDAGCGTGLCGPFLRGHARRLVGVDLSARMLAKAGERALYDELVEAELTAYIAAHPQSFDVIASADTLCYFGRLDEVAAAAFQALRPGGYLVFTVEKATVEGAPGPGYVLGLHGRYAHGDTYVRDTLSAAGLRVERLLDDVLRLEMKQNVNGLVVVARRP